MFYSRKRLKELLSEALENKGYVFPFAGPPSLFLATIYGPFAIVSVFFNAFWYWNFKSLALVKIYNILAALNIWAATKAATWSIVSLLIFMAFGLNHYFTVNHIIAGIIIFQILFVFAMYYQANLVLKKTHPELFTLK